VVYIVLMTPLIKGLFTGGTINGIMLVPPTDSAAHPQSNDSSSSNQDFGIVCNTANKTASIRDNHRSQEGQFNIILPIQLASRSMSDTDSYKIGSRVPRHITWTM
jgi:hypothetical protein